MVCQRLIQNVSSNHVFQIKFEDNLSKQTQLILINNEMFGLEFFNVTGLSHIQFITLALLLLIKTYWKGNFLMNKEQYILIPGKVSFVLNQRTNMWKSWQNAYFQIHPFFCKWWKLGNTLDVNYYDSKVRKILHTLNWFELTRNFSPLT